MKLWRYLALCLAVAMPSERLGSQQPTDYHADPKFQKEMTAAKDAHTSSDERLGHWKRAYKTSKGQCADCMARTAELELQMGDEKAALVSATAHREQVKAPSDRAYAEMLRGSALMHMNHDKPKPEQLTEADEAFQAVLAQDPSVRLAAYQDGRVLASLHRDQEARTRFAAYVKSAPETDTYRLRAEHFAENPALARARMAPPFTVTTADGKTFTLDSMGGRVVLVDFWATWCGPCNEELPHIKKIAQQFTGQPFVLISVSWDKDEAKWQKFIDAHGMSWPQYRDADHQLSTAYDVQAIPHTFTIDADGILQDEQIGSGSDIEGKLKKLVAKAKAMQSIETAAAGTR